MAELVCFPHSYMSCMHIKVNMAELVCTLIHVSVRPIWLNLCAPHIHKCCVCILRPIWQNLCASLIHICPVCISRSVWQNLCASLIHTSICPVCILRPIWQNMCASFIRICPISMYIKANMAKLVCISHLYKCDNAY